MTRQDYPTMIDAVRDYAQEHYAEGAWSVVIETEMSDDQIAKIIQPARTPKGAIAKMASYLSPLVDMINDAENSAF
jgi:hypothetical protein